MNSPRKVIFAVLGIALLASTALLAQDIPVRNWTVPVFDAEALKYAELRPFTHTQGNTPAIFVPYGPCRLTDSRVVSGGPGPIAGGATRDYDFVPGGCSGNTVSEPILAWSLNFSVVNTAGPGFLLAYPTGGSSGGVSILNYTGAAGEIRNNAAIVPVNAATGSITVQAGVSATDVIIDTNGLFLNALEPNTSFIVVSEVDDAAIVGQNTSTAAGAQGVRGHIISAAPGSSAAGVRAQNNSTTGLGYGLWASHAGGATAVFGSSVTGWGGYFYHSAAGDNTEAVRGRTDGTANGSTGVRGTAGATGFTFGVKGSTASIGFDAAGVKGVSGYGDPQGDSTDCDPCFTAGVRGVDTGTGTFIANSSYGVLGLSRTVGVAGMLLDAALGTGGGVVGAVDTDAEGYLGRRSGAATFYGVLSLGGTGATGIKSFIEPHKLDASKVIRYVALEGPEAGTYFRGRGRFQNGIATIDVPEDFRLVTDPDGLSIQVTPIGEMATVAVASIGLDRIVVRGSRNVEFFYTVNGVRATFKDHQPIGDGNEFVPRKADSRMPRWLSEGQKQLLIRNGTYNLDGTVNMETARRLGWDRIWEEQRRQPEPQPLAAEPQHAPGEKPD